MLRLASLLLRFLVVLNILAAVLIAVALAGSFPAGDFILQHLRRHHPPDSALAILEWVRFVFLIGIGAAVAAHFILTRLAAMVATVTAGDPFIETNSRRLHVIAWALLALQLLDLGFGYVDWRFSHATDQPFTWSFALTGWLALLMTFVLARVFAAGTAMRNELEGTI